MRLRKGINCKVILASIVVRCNAEQDLYEVRPALGGPGQWLNRKMPIIVTTGVS